MKQYDLLSYIAVFMLVFVVQKDSYAKEKVMSEDYWNDPLVLEVNRLPARAHFFAFAEDPGSFQVQPWDSSNFYSLNGTWQFYLAATPHEPQAGFTRGDYDDSKWGTINVPGNWEFSGYHYPNYVNMRADWSETPTIGVIPSENNLTGRYRKVFSLPTDWQNERVVLHIGAVKSAIKIWVNGEFVGYSQDSKTAAEFDISRWLQTGENIIAFEVYRWSDGSFLELQDMWRLNGIERDVYLYRTPKTHIKDIELTATLDDSYQNGKLGLVVSIDGGTNPVGKVEVQLFNSSGEALWQGSTDVADSKPMQYLLENVKAWSAESPYLYPLRIKLFDTNNHVTQVVWLRAGFRRSELKNGNILINGQPVLFKGVNRHEHDAKTGHVISFESMQQDLALMKGLNINAVRNSHYPNHPLWYALADEVGMYLVDEANLESHGIGAANQGHFYDQTTHMVSLPHWKPAYIDRVRNMYEASKNHASVVMLSTGNESGDGPNTEAMYHWLKQRTNLPVMAEQAQLRPHTDIYAQMYASLPLMESFVELGSDRPMILCEYEHAMGNSLGNLGEYWDLIRKHDALQGGFIWDWVDQTISTTNKDGVKFEGYGGDFEPEGVYHDGNFSANGLVQSDRQLHPHAFEVKKVYQDVEIRSLDPQNGKITLFNRRYFTNLSDRSLTWLLLEDGKPVQQGQALPLAIEAQSEQSITLPVDYTFLADKRYHLTVQIKAAQASLGIKVGDTVASEQFSLPLVFSNARKPTVTKSAFQIGQEMVKVSAKDNLYTFDKTSGWLSQIDVKGKPSLAQPMVPWFWRAPTDNDFGEGFPEKAKVWQQIYQQAELVSLDVQESGGMTELITEHFLQPVQSRYQTRYKIYVDGSIQVSVAFLAAPNHFYPALPRLGYRLVLKDQYDTTNWFGRGPHESYWDRKRSADFGLYSSTIEALSHDYVRPQENGHRTDVYKVAFSGQTAPSFEFVGEPLIGFNAEYHNLLDYDQFVKKGLHPHDIPETESLYVYIDYKQRGVAGTDSWMTPPLFKYTLPWRDYFYTFSILPTAL